MDRPYVVMISFDGFRNDYLRLYDAPNVQRMADAGSSSSALLPCYPSTTFANHYSIVTGLYPAHHGIVDNNFYDPHRREEFQFNNPRCARDGSWYGGTPLWALAETQGVRTASYFWVGSEAEIGGVRPSYYFNYEITTPGEIRVQQVLDWLALPAGERPHLVTLYFSDVDAAGHAFGPESPECARAVTHLDTLIGTLLRGLERSGLPVNVILVSDHGMIKVQQPPLELDTLADLKGFVIAWSGGQMMFYSSDQARADTLYHKLRGRDGRFRVYRRAELAALHYTGSDRIGDVVVLTDPPFMVSTGEITQIITQYGASALPRGWHGYDVRFVPEMAGIFVACGPNVRSGHVLRPFENIHLYPFVAGLLGLNINFSIDSNPGILHHLLLA